MNTVYLVTFTRDGNVVHRFVYAGDFDHASYLAGKCLDALADYHGLTFDYSVEKIPYAGTMTAWTVIRDAALEADV